MKAYLNKLYLDYITLNPEKKKKLHLSLFFGVFIVVILMGSLFYLNNRSVTNIVKTVEESKTGVEETTSVNGVSGIVKPKDEIKTSFLTNQELETEIFTQTEDVKENYDLKQKIELSNEDNFGEIIVMFLKLTQISSGDITNLNGYLSKIKQPVLTKNCIDKKCTLKEKLDIYDELSSYSSKLVQQKTEVSKTLTNIISYNTLGELKSYLDKNNMCSDKDIIGSYLVKLRISGEKKQNEQRFLDFKDKYLGDNQMINYIMKIDTLSSEKNVEVSFSDFENIKSSKIISYTINIGTDKIKTEYYDYNSQLFEKSEIDKLSNQETNELVAITKNTGFVYFFGGEYITTNEGKIKVYIPKLVLLKDKGIIDTLTYIYLASVKDNCNSRDFLTFTNYETDVNSKTIISNIISNYKTQKSLLSTGQIDITKANEISLQIKEYELLMSTVFIY